MKRVVLTIFFLLLILTGCVEKEIIWEEQYELGVRYLSEGLYEEAVLSFTAVIEINPKYEDAWKGLADAYIAQGKVEEALSALRQGVEETNSDMLSRYEENLSTQNGATTPMTCLEEWRLSRKGTTSEVWALSAVSFHIPDGRVLGTDYFSYDEFGRLVRIDYDYEDNDQSISDPTLNKELIADIWYENTQTNEWTEAEVWNLSGESISEEIESEDTDVKVAGTGRLEGTINVALNAFFPDYPIDSLGTFYYNAYPDKISFKGYLSYLPNSKVEYSFDSNGNVSRIDLYDEFGELHSYSQLTFEKVTVLQ